MTEHKNKKNGRPVGQSKRNSGKSKRSNKRGRKNDHLVMRNNAHNRMRSSEKRTLESREQELRYLPFEPGQVLEAPPARPGMVNKWITYKIFGQIQDSWFMNLRYGYRPVDPDLVEDMELYQMIEYHDGSKVISVGQGMVLCEIHESRADEISQAWETRASKKTASQRRQQMDQFGQFAGRPVGVVDDDHDWNNYDSKGREVVRQNIAGLIGEELTQ